MNIHEELYKYNDLLISGNEYNGNEMFNSLSFIDYKTKVIISASHSTKTTLDGRKKNTDLYTGALVKYIGEKNNISHIIRTKYIPKEENIWDFVQEKNIINKYFIDFHGFGIENDFHLAVGTGYLDEASFSDEIKYIKELAKELNIDLVVNNPKYMGKVGLTGHMQKMNSNNKALQFEWRIDYRDIYHNIDTILSKTIPFTEKMAEFLENM